MQSTIKKLPGSEIEITFEVPFEELEAYFPKAAEELSLSINIPGFRPGKAPFGEVRKHVSEFSLMEKAAGYAVEDLYNKVIQEKKIEVVGHPSVEVTKLASQNPLVFRVKVAQVPEIQLPDWRKIAQETRKKEKKTVEVSDSEVEEAMAYLKQSRRTFHDVARPCKNGDRVEITFRASENGVLNEGISSKSHPLILGEGKFLPGFENEIVGLQKGDAKNFTLQVPSDWWQEEIRGKSLTFHVIVDLVQEIQEPELNDDFAKSQGNFQNMGMLSDSVKEGIREEKETRQKERVRGLVLESIQKKISFEIPRILVASEKERLLRELRISIEGVGLKFDDYIAQAHKTEEDIKKELEKEAEKRVAVGFILRAIAKETQIAPTDDEIRDRTNRELSRYNSVKEAQKNIDSSRLKEYIKGVLRNEKALQLLCE